MSLPMNVGQLLNNLEKPKKIKGLVLAYYAIDLIINMNVDMGFRLFTHAQNLSNGMEHVHLDNGSGDLVDFIFDNGDVCIKGFGHESNLIRHAYDSEDEMPVKINEFYCGLPDKYRNAFNLAAVDIRDVTYCVWSDLKRDLWLWGNYSLQQRCYDGFTMLFETFVPKSDTYIEQYEPNEHQDETTIAHIKKIMTDIIDKQFLDQDSIRSLNPKADVGKIAIELSRGPAGVLYRK